MIQRINLLVYMIRFGIKQDFIQTILFTNKSCFTNEGLFNVYNSYIEAMKIHENYNSKLSTSF